jgi:predicted RNA-binding protein with PUA-like domain
MKTEPDAFSIDDLARDKKGHWDGVRNFQARNFMKEMHEGDLVLFYHSSVVPPGVAGLARVCREAYPDFTQWDKKSDYHDPRATKEKPFWFMVDVEFVEKFKRVVTLEELRGNPRLEGMVVLKKGRLSVQPVSAEHFQIVKKMGS